MRTVIRISSALAALLLAGCGGSDGDPSRNDPPNDAANVPPSAPSSNSPSRGTDVSDPAALPGANGGLLGSVWTERDSGFMDLDTGRTTYVGGDDGARPRDDGQEFVTLDVDVRFVDDPSCNGNGKTFLDRVTVHDTASGLAVAGFDIVEDVREVPRLSPDGLTLAGHWQDDSVCIGDESALTVWDREGRQLARSAPTIGDFDWLPDGRLVFEIDGDIGVETARNTFDYRRITDLAGIPGTPRALDVSPDGTSVVFEMSTGNNLLLSSVRFREATVWQATIDGGTPARIVDTSRTDAGESRYVNAPMFSPDGRELMVTENWLSGGAVTLNGFEGPEFPIITGAEFVPIENGAVTQVVPLAQLPVALPPDRYRADGVRPVFARDDDAALEIARLWPLEGRRWTPSVAAASTVTGDLPAVDGRINRGIDGTLFRHRDDQDSPALERLDLVTGLVSAVPVPARMDLTDLEYLAVSDDANRFVVITYAGLEYTLWAFDARGQEIGSYDLEGSGYHIHPESSPRFAPNSNSTLVWAYDDDDFGQQAVVFDIESGNFGPLPGNGFVDAVDWFPNGDLLLVDGHTLMRSQLSSQGFSPPTLVASLGTRVLDARVSPDGNTIVYADGRQLISLDLTTGVEQRLTAWTDRPTVAPEFSPDGRHLVFKKLGDFDFGWPWVIAQDARHVRIGDVTSAPGAMRVGEGSDLDWRVIRSEVLWR